MPKISGTSRPVSHLVCRFPGHLSFGALYTPDRRNTGFPGAAGSCVVIAEPSGSFTPRSMCSSPSIYAPPIRGVRLSLWLNWQLHIVNARSARPWYLRSPGFGPVASLYTAQSRDHGGSRLRRKFGAPACCIHRSILRRAARKTHAHSPFTTSGTRVRRAAHQRPSRLPGPVNHPGQQQGSRHCLRSAAKRR
jgi:hypothetical protein